MDEYLGICENCVSQKELKEIILDLGSPINKCSICNSENIFSIFVGNSTFKQAFRVFIRLYFDEEEYNDHLGGDQIEGLLFESNKLFNMPKGASVEAYEEATKALCDDWYLDHGNMISLGSGYWENPPFRALTKDFDDRLLDVIKKVFNTNYFELIEELKSVIKIIHADLKYNLKAKTKLSRARIGVTEKFWAQDGASSTGYCYTPYVGSEISAPPVFIAKQGRLNRENVSILYTATNVKTALAEVRPFPGNVISVGSFEPKLDLSIADFSGFNVIDYLNDTRLSDLRLKCSFDNLLRIPVSLQNGEQYLATQLISDCIRELGFDGILFNSSVSDGKNLICFYPGKCSYVEGSEEVFTITGIEYHSKQRRLSRDIHDLLKYKHDQSPFSTMYEAISSNRHTF